MRAIKFRAWKVNKKTMIAPDDLIFHEYTDVEDHFQNDELIFLQFTGLLDKNGTEIYEFDVIKSCRTGLNYKVVWDDASAAFTALCTNLEKDYYIGPYSWADTEIIGNIHESPELKEK